MRGVILTCKHHDGFCLWPTKTTDHSVFHSAWRGGKGDVVREISQAAARRKLKFGVYLSPWDRNNAAYGTPEYIKIYRAQLSELLTGYGPIFEVWHDGANGGDGFYGGAREKRTIDKNSYYDWPRTWEMIRAMQPDAVVFSDVGPDVRWVGNERGIAGDPCWASFDPVGEDGGPASPGNVRTKESTSGQRHASKWLPAECDVSIRPGWFWHEAENARVKKPAQLTSLYYQSVGRGATLLLNVPPNRDGLLSPEDVASLQGFGAYLRATFTPEPGGARQGRCHPRARQRQAIRPRAPAGRPPRYLLGHRRQRHQRRRDLRSGTPREVSGDPPERGHSIRAADRRVHRRALAVRLLDAGCLVHQHRAAPPDSPGCAHHRHAPALAHHASLGEPRAPRVRRLLGSRPGLIALPLVYLYWFFAGPVAAAGGALPAR